MDRRPCLIVAYADPAFAARWGRFFRRQGWEVHLTPSDAEMSHLVDRLGPTAVVIDADEAPGAAWNREHAGVEVLLVGGGDTRAVTRLSRQADPEEALEQIQARLLAVA